nr:NosD domain-containing protein [Candidatus Baldrarchaeota archaeon]
SGNTISNNSKGIVIFNSVNNIIYHNNFIDNIMDAQISSSNNIWSYKGEGNYWSRYSGRDSNQDGIGDQPYLISDRGSDICPLMGMFFGFEIILNEEKRNVNIISNSSISNYAFRTDETGSVILCFEATTEKFVSGFVRVAVPAELADNPIIVLIDNVEVQPKVLNTPDTEHLHLYISYNWGKHTIQIISSTVLGLYREIVTLNSSYQLLLEEYSALLANYSELKLELSMLNSSYSALLANYTALQQNYTKLNSDYQEHLLDYSENLQNTQNLVYILMTSTAVFLAVTVYLSRQAHVAAENKLTKSKEQF